MDNTASASAVDLLSSLAAAILEGAASSAALTIEVSAEMIAARASALQQVADDTASLARALAVVGRVMDGAGAMGCARR